MMEKTRTTKVAAALLVVFAALSACSEEVGGTPEGMPQPDPPAASASAPSAEAPAVAGVGECVNGSDPAPVDCAGPHTVEITKAGEFDQAIPAGKSWRDVIFTAVFPICRKEAATYLGSQDYDATTLGAWMLWPDETRRAKGDRWYRCGVATLGADGSAEAREGSVKGILAGGMDRFRLCFANQPSKQTPQRIACDQPHLSEAVAVVPMGKPTDPYPSERAMQQTANQACTDAMVDYLGRSRNDVFASWRWPAQADWRQGFNNISCYVETKQPYTGTLAGLGARPLPK